MNPERPINEAQSAVQRAPFSAGTVDPQTDPQRLRRRLDEGDRQRSRDARADVVVEFPRRLFLRAPGGHYFQVTVGDDGKLVATDVGATLP